MSVKLEATIRRYIGLSTDAKPLGGPGEDGGAPDIVPPGTSFLETDTGRIFRWDGIAWTYTDPNEEVVPVLQLILVELVKLRELTELATS